MENRKIILCNFDDDTTNKLLEVVPKVLEFKEETVNKDPNIDTNKSDKK